MCAPDVSDKGCRMTAASAAPGPAALLPRGQGPQRLRGGTAPLGGQRHRAALDGLKTLRRHEEFEVLTLQEYNRATARKGNRKS